MTLKIVEVEVEDSFHNYHLINTDGEVLAVINRQDAATSDCWIERTYGTDWQVVGLNGELILPRVKDKNDMIKSIESHFSQKVVLN